MADSPFDAEATRVRAAFPRGPRLVVLGSGSFWGADSRPLCEAVAADLAEVVELVAVTGGRSGVGLTFGRAFAAARREAGYPENLFHLLPHGKRGQSAPRRCGSRLNSCFGEVRYRCAIRSS